MSYQDFRNKVIELRKSFEKDIQIQIIKFENELHTKLQNIQLSDPHVIYFSKHLPRFDAIQITKYLNKSYLNQKLNWIFHAQPETQFNEDHKEVLTGFYSIITVY